MSLALDLRPKSLEEVIGHETLKPGIKKFIQENQKHWLFSGPTGTGKTTFAYIVAQEMDAHVRDFDSTSGVTGMRELLSEIGQYPMTKTRRAIIVDEAHKLTSDSQDLLLTTFEKPDDVNIWILCTTDLPGQHGRQHGQHHSEKDRLRRPLRDRCDASFLLKEMNSLEREELIKRGAKRLNSLGKGIPAPTLDRFRQVIDDNVLRSARDILSSLERVANHIPVEEAVEV